MPSPIVYDVVPAANAWFVRIAGDSLSEAYATKEEALARGRELAERDKGRVRVLNAAGMVEAEVEVPARSRS